MILYSFFKWYTKFLYNQSSSNLISCMQNSITLLILILFILLALDFKSCAETNFAIIILIKLELMLTSFNTINFNDVFVNILNCFICDKKILLRRIKKNQES